MRKSTIADIKHVVDAGIMGTPGDSCTVDSLVVGQFFREYGSASIFMVLSTNPEKATECTRQEDEGGPLYLYDAVEIRTGMVHVFPGDGVVRVLPPGLLLKLHING